MKNLRLAVDIGGTFVDAIAFDINSGSISLEKSSTTPSDAVKGVLNALDKLNTNLSDVETFIHGTTLGLNAVLELKGASTGIITNAGFRDILEIGRGDVPVAHMYNSRYQKPPPLVKRRHRLGVPGRIDVEGKILVDLDEVKLLEAARRLIEDHGVAAIAICFLHSYQNDLHEQRAAALIRESFPGTSVSVSSDIAREYREYERTSTTVLDAYIRPIFEAYISELENALSQRDFSGNFLIMRSSGGAMTADVAKTSPIHTVLSGPAGGIIGATHVARSLKKDRLLSLDFGGTSLDACLIEGGRANTMYEAKLELNPVLIPIFDIRCIGAGGGSIAWLEENFLKVGPQSAGASPGPIAYGRGGTEPTTTDAALQLGYLDPEKFLGGEMDLDSEASRRGIQEKIATPLNQGVVQASAGIFDVMIARTVGAIRELTVEHGHDPLEFSLLAFGGAGPMFAPLLAREMEIPETIIPNSPAAFSAWGMLMCDLTTDFSRTQIGILEETDPATLDRGLDELAEQARSALRSQNVPNERQSYLRSLELRYLGQEHALEVPLGGPVTPSEIRVQFDELHQLRYGHTTSDLIQTVTLRVRGIGLMDQPEMPRLKNQIPPPDKPVLREAYCFALGKTIPFTVLNRDQLGVDSRVDGPAIVNEGTSTTVFFSDQYLTVDEYGNLRIQSH